MVPNAALEDYQELMLRRSERAIKNGRDAGG
jgi:hypothetical protein